MYKILQNSSRPTLVFFFFLRGDVKERESVRRKENRGRERERARKGRRKRGGGRKEYKGREAKETSISLIHPRTLQPLLLLFIYFLPFGVRSFFLI